jgi:hypothetical protein
MRPFTVTGLKAGSSQTVNLRGYLDSPLEKPACSIDAATVSSGKGLSVSRSGCDLTVTASGEASGRGTIDVVVSDGPGRSAPGRGAVEMLGKPGAPTSVVAVADRVSGGTARVRWVPPAYDGGSPITTYTVSWRGAASDKRTCSASPCTIDGLQDGKDYWFRVTATNAVGESPASAEYGPVQPDTLPNPVSGVRMTGRGDSRLDIAWQQPAPKGSEITEYNVRVTDTSTGQIKTQPVTAPALQATVSGLENNHEQSVAVRARNRLGWGPFGPAVTMQSAGTPPAVGTPTLRPMTDPEPGDSSTSVQVRWNAVSPNGPALSHYTVFRRTNGDAWLEMDRTSGNTTYWTDQSVPYDGRTYEYVVTATNGAGQTSPRSNSSSISPSGYPERPKIVNPSTPSPNYGASFSVSLAESNAKGYQRLEWKSGGKSGFLQCACPENAVTNKFQIDGLGTSRQDLQVRAYNNAGRVSPWSAAVSIHPYGPTQAPKSNGYSANGRTITYKWTWNRNGRAATGFQIYRGGTRIASVTGGERSWSHTWPKDDTSYPIKVYAVAEDSGRSAGYADINGRTDPPPQASVTVLDPSKHRTAGTCDNYNTCYEIQFQIKNFEPGDYTFTCSSSAYGEFYSASMRVTDPNSYTKNGWCVVDTRNNDWAGIQISGGPSGTRSGKNYNW